MKISETIKVLSEHLEKNGDGEIWLVPFSSLKLTNEFGIFQFDDYHVNEAGNLEVLLSGEFPEASKNDVFIDELF
jgi:hypothetical protein